MKRKFVRFLICVMFGVMLFAVPSGAKDYDNGNFCINCSLTYKSSKATGTTNGAPSNYYNRVLVYTRNKNGTVVASAYSLCGSSKQASATTSKASSAKTANSYHFVSDKNGNSIESLRKQVVLSK